MHEIREALYYSTGTDDIILFILLDYHKYVWTVNWRSKSDVKALPSAFQNYCTNLAAINEGVFPPEICSPFVFRSKLLTL